MCVDMPRQSESRVGIRKPHRGHDGGSRPARDGAILDCLSHASC